MLAYSCCSQKAYEASDLAMGYALGLQSMWYMSIW